MKRVPRIPKMSPKDAEGVKFEDERQFQTLPNYITGELNTQETYFDVPDVDLRLDIENGFLPDGLHILTEYKDKDSLILDLIHNFPERSFFLLNEGISCL